MTVRPFLFLGVRPEDDAAADEYQAMLRATGLTSDQLHRVRVEKDVLPTLDLSSYSGVLLGGSPYCVSDPEETKSAVQKRVEADLDGLLAEILAADIPFMGCCYGIGTLGRHLGGVVDHTYGEDVGGVQITVTEDGAADPVFGAVDDSFSAFVGHKEALSQLPAGAQLLATSATAPVQAFRVGKAYAIQFHPELDLQGLEMRMRTYQNHGYFQPEELEPILERASRSGADQPPAVLHRFVEVYASSSDGGSDAAAQS